MGNKGYVTVFVSLMLVVMLVVTTAVIHIVDMSSARTKIDTAASSACSSELANYNRFIYDRYHILLLDSQAGGRGEGALEQEMVELLKIDLGEDYQVNDVELSGMVGIMDDDLAEFKKQLNDNFVYDLLDYGIEKIADKTGENDTPVDEDTFSYIDENIAEEQNEIKEREESEKEGGSDDTDDSEGKDGKEDEPEEVTDPRDTLKTYTDAGIASMLLPEDVSMSENIVDKTDIPSSGIYSKDEDPVDTNFTSYNQMKLDTSKYTGWGNELITKAESLAYIRKYFNSLTDKEYDDTYLNFEVEYLIAGKDTDGANYKSVVDDILLIRFGVNFASIIFNSSKMAICDTIAIALTWYFPALQPVIKYLLAGCWAYIESIADVYLLLRGHKVSFFKTESTWITDLESLGHLDDYLDEPSDEENGLDYNDYLSILIVLKGDVVYYRMLDIMQLNATQDGVKGSDTSFRMKNAITAFGANTTVTYKDREYGIYEEAGY